MNRAALRRPSARGLTLVELMISCAIVVFAVAAASSVLISQSRAMQGSDLNRQANGSSRDAIMLLEPTLRMAGWGIDPRWAIDFTYACPASPAVCRDNVDAPDELAFVTREPKYRWLASGEAGCGVAGGCFSGFALSMGPGSGVVTVAVPPVVQVTLPAGAVLEKGRVVELTCPGGLTPVMLTMSEQVDGTGALVDLPFEATETPYNQFSQIRACHGQAGAGIFLVNRYRYYVETHGTTPWLMLDNGLDADEDGVTDRVPIAKNVEDMQVAYVMNSGSTAATDSNTDRIFGNETNEQEAPSLTATAPEYSTPSINGARSTAHPANIRSIRVTLVIRSDRRDPRMPQDWTGESINSPENGTVVHTGGGFRRYTAQTTVHLRNLESRNPFIF